MPSRGIMRAKQLRGGSLGQGTRFYYMAGRSFASVAGAQGFGKTNPSIGSMKSLGVMKQNRNAGGNNVCKETMIPSFYYTQKVSLNMNTALLPIGSLIYIAGTQIPLGKVIRGETYPSVLLYIADSQKVLTTGQHKLMVDIVSPNTDRTLGIQGIITFADPAARVAT